MTKEKAKIKKIRKDECVDSNIIFAEILLFITVFERIPQHSATDLIGAVMAH
jgi:hypothetical protein